MKYSSKCLDKALGFVLPNYETYKSQLNRVAALNIAAKHVFLFPDNFNGTDQTFAVFLIRKALLELHETGCLETGDADEFWM